MKKLVEKGFPHFGSFQDFDDVKVSFNETIITNAPLQVRSINCAKIEVPALRALFY
jgi:hypothetical protein